VVLAVVLVVTQQQALVPEHPTRVTPVVKKHLALVVAAVALALSAQTLHQILLAMVALVWRAALLVLR
jgi:hypothetical protein